MEFVLERKGYRENEEEGDDDDEDEGEEIRGSSKFPLSSSSSCYSSKPKPYDNYSKRQIHQKCEEQVLVGTRSRLHEEECHTKTNNQLAGKDDQGRVVEVEREHMFDKVVTPSDVGKLNRLVIPKQHAEKYFPLHSSSSSSSATTGGALLDFEDRNGKQWRFRYSYWNSSQSYVMTKGWSRFVKEKKLNAGDIVSFNRSSCSGVGGDCEDYRRLFIDWRHQPKQQQQYEQHLLLQPGGFDHLQHQHQQQLMIMNNYNYLQRPYLDHHHYHHPYHHHHHQRGAGAGAGTGYGGEMKNVGPSIYNLRYSMGDQQYHQRIVGMDNKIPMVINSVPVLHPINRPHPRPLPHPLPHPESTAISSSSSSLPKARRGGLRLFGVNMEEYCPIETDDHIDDDDDDESKTRVLPSVPYYTLASSLLSTHYHLPTSSTSLLRPPPPPPPTLPSTTGKTSLSFDLHLSDSE